MQWRKVMTADYNKFNLVIDDEYKSLPIDEYVHDHKGELIYFFTYNPSDIPVYNADAERIIDEEWLDKIHESKKPYGIQWGISELGHTNYNMPGADCSGVPTFCHWTEERVTQEDTWNYYGHDKFEPLTVGTVLKWFGWFLFQLQNSYLKIGKQL